MDPGPMIENDCLSKARQAEAQYYAGLKVRETLGLQSGTYGEAARQQSINEILEKNMNSNSDQANFFRWLLDALQHVHATEPVKRIILSRLGY